MNIISKHRSACMGLGIILIMICHSSIIIDNPTINNAYVFIQQTSQVGVDIFLFLSGLGLYFSFNKDSNLLSFYRKRITRIIPIYLFAVICFTGILHVRSIEEYSLFSFFTKGNVSFWFVPAILLLYICFPFLYWLIKRVNGLYFGLISGGGVLVLSGIISVLDSVPQPLSVVNSIFIVRIPVFLLGMYIARKYLILKKAASFKVIYAICLGVFAIIAIIVNNRYNSLNPSWTRRLIFGPLAFSVIFLCSSALEHRNTYIDLAEKHLAIIGTSTLEIYLLYDNIRDIYLQFSNDFKTSIMVFVASVCTTIVLSLILSQLKDRTMLLIQSKLNNKIVSKESEKG